MSEWISVKTPPEQYKEVLVFPYPSDQTLTAYYQPVRNDWIYMQYETGHGWFDYTCKPTHWMPLPEPPKEEQ